MRPLCKELSAASLTKQRAPIGGEIKLRLGGQVRARLRGP